MNPDSSSDLGGRPQSSGVVLPEDEVSSVGVEFLALVAEDRLSGRARTLAEYLREFHGHEREVVRAWQEVFDRGRGATPRERSEGPHAAEVSGMVGPYRLERELGRGAQGIVWLATDTRIGRRVALKTAVRSPLFSSLGPRLEREAQALARLEHPSISQVYDVGATESVAWIAMRYEPGRTLADLIASGDAARAVAQDILAWFVQAARALDAAHTAGFLHRDVKPSNLLVRNDGVVVVLDFGVAAPSDGSGVPLTLTGDVVGTPAYMAPEQLSTGMGALDRRADVWALGVSLYEALVGTRPFVAATREDEARRALQDDPFPLPAAALRGLGRRDVETVLATALAKDARHRYSTAAGLADDLARLAVGQAPLARRPGPLLRFARWARRRPGLASALAALVLFAVATAALYARSSAQLRDIRRLSDLETAIRLLSAADSLHPLTPASAIRAAEWLEAAAELLGRRALHAAALERAAGDDSADDVGTGWSERGEEAASQWLRAQLGALLDRFDELAATRDYLAPRVSLARDLAQVTLEQPADAWQAAAARVGADPRFAGFALRPQLGLVPLGPDPDSGLEEFAHVQSGAVPARDAVTGKLVLTDDVCVVLVLVPFGETMIGATLPEEDGPHPDPFRGVWDGPPQTLRLDPYFISKYELTRAQWEAHARTQGGYYDTGSELMRDTPMLHPAEHQTDASFQRLLGELGLEAPTEAQWEHAARAGSATPWSFGEDRSLIGTYGNVADQSARDHQPEVGWQFEFGVRDGFAFHAPVGRFAANAWGLHDVHGNVRELTRSTWEDWEEHPPRDGDGSTEVKYEMLTVRGGSFDRNAVHARSAYRDGHPLKIPMASLGVRPSRRYAP